MIECLILGDSIAKGLGQIRPECVSYAQNGINSRDYNNIYTKHIKPANTVIISLGSNDYKNLNTEVELVALRSFVESYDVIWIVPANKPEKADIVKRIARAHDDTFILIPEVGPDRVHPTSRGYKQLKQLTK
jgi:hypothetical protein